MGDVFLLLFIGPVLGFFGILAAALGLVVFLVAVVRLLGAARGLVASGGRLGVGLSVEPMALDQPLVHGGVLAERDLDIVEVALSADSSRCPVCATDLGSEPVVRCSRCATAHHRDCWEFNGACAVFGCGVGGRRPTTDSSSLSSPSPALVAALVADTEGEALALRRRFRRWFWVTRIQWWSLLALSAQVCAAAILHAMDVLPAVPTLVLVPLAGLGGVSVLALGLSLVALRRLDDSLQGPALMPPERLAALVRRIEHSRSLPVLERWVRRFPAVYGTAAVPCCVGVLVKGSPDPYVALPVLFAGAAFAGVARWSAVRHRRVLDRVRARLWRHGMASCQGNGEVVVDEAT